MSIEPLIDITATTDEPTLFDRLARLVPHERQAEYYRVLAHTRTLHPDDEMLRVLEAMGVLTLLTQETPQQIAVERERIAELLQSTLAKMDGVQSHTSEYVSLLEKRIKALPTEVRAGLDPLQIAKLLGESLRQNFIETGLPQTAHALHSAVDGMTQTQKKLTGLLSEVSHPSHGIIAQAERTNNALSRSLEERARKIDHLLSNLNNHLVCVWLPTIATAAFCIGCAVGIEWEGRRIDSTPTQVVVQPQIPDAQTLPQPPVNPQKGHRPH